MCLKIRQILYQVIGDVQHERLIMDERRLVKNVFASVIYQVYSPSHGPRAPVTTSKLVSVSGQPTEQQADVNTEDVKEATICNHF